jgi:hypothetical protein
VHQNRVAAVDERVSPAEARHHHWRGFLGLFGEEIKPTFRIKKPTSLFDDAFGEGSCAKAGRVCKNHTKTFIGKGFKRLHRYCGDLFDTVEFGIMKGHLANTGAPIGKDQFAIGTSDLGCQNPCRPSPATDVQNPVTRINFYDLRKGTGPLIDLPIAVHARTPNKSKRPFLGDLRGKSQLMAPFGALSCPLGPEKCVVTFGDLMNPSKGLVNHGYRSNQVLGGKPNQKESTGFEGVPRLFDDVQFEFPFIVALWSPDKGLLCG